MKSLGFYTFLFFEKLISVLPLSFSYLLSYFFYIILNYILKYRKDIVIQNLKNSFPDKSEEDIMLLRKKYMKIMADLIIESLRFSKMTKENFLKHFEFKNLELLDELYNKNKSVFVACGHTGSWELAAMVLPLVCKHKVFAIYQPQKNQLFDEYIKKIRGSFGLELLASKQAYKNFISNRNILTLNYILGDQSPSKDGDNYWTNFLNQETAFFTGLEKMSKSLDFAVVFLRIIRRKRSNYMLEFQLLTKDAKQSESGEISELYVRALENLILEYPENWLWSHRRWKHKRIN